METVFATYSGCVQNTCVVESRSRKNKYNNKAHDGAGNGASASNDSGLGGQIGKIMAAANTVGWNHHQVPQNERSPS